ncbi:MAG: Maf family nucleotide pyrophosphatase [Betaproteobacteria bacterium]|jgi:septum formation protein|nr:Maf family nucleotide pyrophosphatase [Betaproteobacteria bacterium]
MSPQTTSHRTPPPLILGSTSVYRAELLRRLQLPFTTVQPNVDETPLSGETPLLLAKRLALAKANAVADRHPDAVVIGSDQVADLHGEALGKPGNHARATQQLKAMSGQLVIFHTAVAVVYKEQACTLEAVSQIRVQFRTLTDDEIDRYLRIEQPYDCAGSAKSEGLGISLLSQIDNDDPTALIGLPLIKTCEMLRTAGIQVP